MASVTGGLTSATSSRATSGAVSATQQDKETRVEDLPGTDSSTIYQPWDALTAPRFTGPRTYARLPHVTTLDGVDAAVYGMPWNGGTSFRSGARFGPEAIRSASGMIRTYNAVQGVQVFGALSSIDYGDSPTAPGYIEE